MLLGPGADLRQVRPEPLGHDVVGVADEQRAVAHARVTGDLLDHLGVVVGGEERLTLTAVLHRQPADEVGQPHVSGALALRVLVQEVVDVPRLVADPQVVRLLAHDVVEDHVVRDQDLVHPPPCVEAVQVVLGRLGLDVAGLVREQGAGGVDALALRLEHPRDRMLGEPVDLEVGMRGSAAPSRSPRRGGRARARSASRRTARAGGGRGRASRRARAASGNRTKSRSSTLTLTGSRACGQWPAPSSVTSSPPVTCASAAPLGMWADQVAIAVDHEHRALHALAGLAELLEPAEVERRHRVGERRGVGLERPADAVLDLLRRVRLVEDPGEEELEEALVVPLPVVAVVLRPALVGVELLLEAADDRSLGEPWGERNRRADVGDRRHTVGVVRGEQGAPQRAARDSHEHRALGVRRVQHGDRVGRELGLDVRGDPARAVRLAVAAPVEGDDAEMTCEVGDLRLPVARVDDRPGREQQQRRVAVAVDLVEDAHAVALDVALLVGVAGA